MKYLNNIDTLFVDLDGTVYIEGMAIPSVIDTLNNLHELGKEIYFLSNNSSKDHNGYAYVLKTAGLSWINGHHIVISSDYVARESLLMNLNCYVFGTNQLQKQFKSNYNWEYDVVIVGYNTEMKYSDLVYVCRLVNSGVPYWLTHPDLTCPSKYGPVPDVGLFAKMIEEATGVSPKKVFGKPNKECVQHIEYDPARTAVVGDRVATDMKLAENIGAKGFLVLTGERNQVLDTEAHYTILNGIWDLCQE